MFNANLEQRLTVRCLSATLNLPIATDTTTNDIRSVAASLSPQSVDMSTAIAVECIVSQGMERNMRGFENVREVMDSWGPCSENFIRIDPRPASCLEQDFIVHTDSPMTISFLLQHTTNPKEWNERWVTLRADGQVLAVDRNEYSTENLEELCHLSTFDIYTFGEQRFKRGSNTPGQFFYALKSQNNSGLSREMVHHFYTADKALAYRFYRQIRCWRSRYLIQQKINVHLWQLTSEEHKAVSRPVGSSSSAAREEVLCVGSCSLRSSSEHSSHNTSQEKEPRDRCPSFSTSPMSVTENTEKLQKALSTPIIGCRREVELDKVDTSPITPWPVVCGSPADYFASTMEQ